MPLPNADWLGLCRRASHAAREAVGGLTSTAERSVQFGEGGRGVAQGRCGGGVRRGARPAAGLVGGEGRGGIPGWRGGPGRRRALRWRAAPGAARAGAAGGARPRDGPPGTGGARGRGDRRAGGAPPARARLGGGGDVPGGGGPPGRDDHPPRGPLGGRCGGAADRGGGGGGGGAAGGGWGWTRLWGAGGGSAGRPDARALAHDAALTPTVRPRCSYATPIPDSVRIGCRSQRAPIPPWHA